MKQGAIVSRRASGRRVWSLRFYVQEGGRRVQKSIYVGGDDQPELLFRARALLARYRARSGWADEIAQFARWASLARVSLGRLAGPAKHRG